MAKKFKNKPIGIVDLLATRGFGLAQPTKLVATTTGKQYVGSAYGAKGIWGRWSAYAQNGHGGIKLLKELVAKHSAYPDAFTYSVLQVLPKTFAPKEVVQREQCYK